ncbi:H(+)/Cl(-) exchange transporter 7-like [Lycorma delicatula]|uniref:H(+)/Cl(-) exchange transporter 7-like n=1 Tax=Lycorma delicatula TaxID=130591 RepID=UPI003F5156C5
MRFNFKDCFVDTGREDMLRQLDLSRLSDRITYFDMPTAAGSGVGLCIAFLNGVDVPNIFSLSVVFYKTISTICTCTSGIIGGKEGPMIHISAALGEVIITLPYVCNLCKPFHNNSELRDLVAAGVGSGIAGSFGSPIGGFLLSVEESVSFLNPQLLFRIFLSTMFAVTVMNCTFSAFYKTDQIGTEHYLYLGKLEDSNIAFTLLEFPAFFLMGTIAGLIGSLCVHLQTSITAIRERHLKSNFAKLIESSLVAVLTSVAQVIFMYLSDSCVEAEQPGNAVKMGCKNGYSESSFYTLSTGEETLRWIVHAKINGINFLPAFCMFIIYYVLAMYTVGINIAVGAFVPNLLIGAMWGRCYVILLNKIFPDIKWFDPVKYTFLAAIAQLSGSLRITFSVTIIAVEITGAVNLLLPLMFTLLTAKWVGDLLTPPWFESQIIFLGLPFILPDPPAFSSEVAVKHIMSKQVITLSPVVFAAEILNILTNHEHGVYPVVDKTDIKLENYENNQKLNLVMIMNSSPYTVRQNMSFERAFVLFRNLGLRQLVVVDSKYQILGIVTRKELARYHAVKDGIIELPLI